MAEPDELLLPESGPLQLAIDPALPQPQETIISSVEIVNRIAHLDVARTAIRSAGFDLHVAYLETTARYVEAELTFWVGEITARGHAWLLDKPKPAEAPEPAPKILRERPREVVSSNAYL